MKKQNKTFTLVAVLVMFALLGFGGAYNNGFDFKGLDLLFQQNPALMGCFAPRLQMEASLPWILT